jgi:hypothetical protein
VYTRLAKARDATGEANGCSLSYARAKANAREDIMLKFGSVILSFNKRFKNK